MTRSGRNIGVAALAAGAAALAWRDYRGWRALGDGGLPANALGWAQVTFYRLLKGDPFDLSVFDGGGDEKALAGGLPDRAGPRPSIAPWPVPHRQLDQFAPTSIRQRQAKLFDAAVRDRAGEVDYRRSHFERHNRAVTLLCPACGHLDAGRTHGEVAHVHPTDGSMHMVLGPRDAVEAIRRGWGERHPLAGLTRRAPPVTYLLVYAPRDELELEVTGRLLAASIRHMTGSADAEAEREPPWSAAR